MKNWLPLVFGPGVGHRERAAHDLVVVELVLERVAGAAGAGALRAPALDHEVLDDAVEDQPVVEAVARELRKFSTVFGASSSNSSSSIGPVVGVHRRLAHRLLPPPAGARRPGLAFPETFSTTSPARSSGTSTKRTARAPGRCGRRRSRDGCGRRPRRPRRPARCPPGARRRRPASHTGRRRGCAAWCGAAGASRARAARALTRLGRRAPARTTPRSPSWRGARSPRARGAAWA